MAKYTAGMFEQAAKAFGFVSLEGGVHTDITEEVVGTDYSINVSEASKTTIK